MPRPQIKKIDLLCFDFDGVLTDNRVWVDENGGESVVCNRADGLGFELLRKAGLHCIIVSTEKNPVVSARAKKLRLPVLQGVDDKARAVRELCRKRGLDLQRCGFVGNDVNDLSALRIVGWRICPADAAQEVRAVCDLVLRAKGGAGVVRELARRLGSSMT
jgi:3-deoxy-D-manno-octulosonate 8-phosphate phosphatase (KDO 8-P phosphatase)